MFLLPNNFADILILFTHAIRHDPKRFQFYGPVDVGLQYFLDVHVKLGQIAQIDDLIKRARSDVAQQPAALFSDVFFLMKH